MVVENQILAWSTALGIFHLAVSSTPVVLQRGHKWGFGPRDEEGPKLGKKTCRLNRSFENFKETFPLFAVSVILVSIANGHSSNTVLGAQLYFWNRLLYIPLYVLGVYYLRTVVWFLSVIGIMMVLSGSLF